MGGPDGENAGSGWGTWGSVVRVHFFNKIRKYGNTDSNSVFYHARLGIIQFI
jgi:hypothetical protein